MKAVLEGQPAAVEVREAEDVVHPVEDEEVLQLPCKHLYHAPCVTRWLVERKRICPICKRDVAKGVDGVLDEG